MRFLRLVSRTKLPLAFLVMLFVQSAVFAQKNEKVSTNKGTLYGYWGYNRSAYTNSDLRFVGPGYDFTLGNASASDNQAKEFHQYVDLTKLTVPQFNIRFGYYFKDNWAISFGYDHMKYLLDDKNEILLSGTIDPGVDNNWSGTYDAAPMVTDRNQIHYENSNGLNFFRFELIRSDILYSTRNQKFRISSNFGVTAGAILSYNDFLFGGEKDMCTISFSGIAGGLNASARFEFFKHVFIQPEFSGGYMNQMKVRTRPNDSSAYASQDFMYGMFSTSVGFYAYLKPKKDCNCPKW